MIDYKKLVRSQEFYLREGYTNLEVPWFVSQKAMDITLPPNISKEDANAFYIKAMDRNAVASAEQSFIQMMLDGEMPMGSYQAMTPCFRFEQEDLFHKKYFMKNELIIFEPINPYEQVYEMVESAKRFFSYFLKDVTVELVTDPRNIRGYDLVSSSRIELGSYGIRRYEEFTWIFGTGCAEPRLSATIEYEKGA